MTFEFPSLPDHSSNPEWNGKCFIIENNTTELLQYSKSHEGWNEGLNQYYEHDAGDGSHYFDQASRQGVISWLNSLKKPSKRTVLIIGCSQGYLLKEIKQSIPQYFIVGTDCIAHSLEKIIQKGLSIPLLQFDLVKCPLPDESIDIVIALNVLEHIEDDIGALKQVYRILKPEGYLYIEVPVNPNLYGFFDEYFKHYRRYSSEQIQKLSKTTEFKVLKTTHLGFFIYPFFKLCKVINRMKKFTSSQKEKVVLSVVKSNGIIQNFLRWMMSVALFISTHYRYPFGIKCILILNKPN